MTAEPQRKDTAADVFLLIVAAWLLTVVFFDVQIFDFDDFYQKHMNEERSEGGSRVLKFLYGECP